MRTINAIYTAELGEEWTNERVLPLYESCIEKLPLEDAARTKLRDFVRFQLVGQRSRRVMIRDWTTVGTFESRASAYEDAAGRFLEALAAQIAPAADAEGITFDAVISTTATGNLMPGLSYRLARRLEGLVRRDTLMIDLGNVGCTGSIKALNLARTLEPSVKNILIAADGTVGAFARTSSIVPAPKDHAAVVDRNHLYVLGGLWWSWLGLI